MSDIQCTCEKPTTTLSGRCFNCYEKLQTKVDELREHVTRVNNKCSAQLDNIYEKYDRLEKAAMKLREAMEFYEDKYRYGIMRYELFKDEGQKAKKAIAEFDEAVKGDG